MRLLLALALVLLFFWLQKSFMSNNDIPCEAASLSASTVSLLLSPLSLYSWLTSTLLRLVLAIPGLIFSILHQSLLLLMAGPWCVASICFSLLFTTLHVALYLLHLALVLGVVAILSLSKFRLVKKDTTKKDASATETTLRTAKLKVTGSRLGHQG